MHRLLRRNRRARGRGYAQPQRRVAHSARHMPIDPAAAERQVATGRGDCRNDAYLLAGGQHGDGGGERRIGGRHGRGAQRDAWRAQETLVDSPTGPPSRRRRRGRPTIRAATRRAPLSARSPAHDGQRSSRGRTAAVRPGAMNRPLRCQERPIPQEPAQQPRRARRRLPRSRQRPPQHTRDLGGSARFVQQGNRRPVSC